MEFLLFNCSCLHFDISIIIQQIATTTPFFFRRRDAIQEYVLRKQIKLWFYAGYDCGLIVQTHCEPPLQSFLGLKTQKSLLDCVYCLFLFLPCVDDWMSSKHSGFLQTSNLWTSCHMSAWISVIPLFSPTLKLAWNVNSPYLFSRCTLLILLWTIHPCIYQLF